MNIRTQNAQQFRRLKRHNNYLEFGLENLEHSAVMIVWNVVDNEKRVTLSLLGSSQISVFHYHNSLERLYVIHLYLAENRRCFQHDYAEIFLKQYDVSDTKQHDESIPTCAHTLHRLMRFVYITLN